VAICKLKSFDRFARSERLSEKSLADAVVRASRGLVDADLGGGLIKQRVARRGQGRSGGYRVLIAFRTGDFAVLLFGFAKNAQGDLDDLQLNLLRRLAGSWLSADVGKIEIALEQGELVELLN
jgi:hypothetical protein